MSSAESQKGGFDEWAQELLTELEQQTPEAIKRMRSSERHEVQSAVKIRPANASDFAKPTVEGVTGDVSPGGCRQNVRGFSAIGASCQVLLPAFLL